MYEFMQSVPFGDEIRKDYYGDFVSSYEQDRKTVRKAQMEVSNLLGQLSPVTDEELLKALPSAFSGRLEYRPAPFGTDDTFEYTAGQFYNIEVPQAVQAVLEEVKRNRNPQN